MLPEDVIELLPKQAQHVEALRRSSIDTMRTWGYQLVMPPLVEFLDSLLAGSGEDLHVQTYTITDQHSGRLMGVRADITPQIARIDAHRLPTTAVSRFAYCGEVLRHRSESTEPRRNPLVLGAELFGAAAVSADVEIIALLLEVVATAGLTDCVVDLGHAGIFAALVETYALDVSMQGQLHDLLAGKKRPDLDEWQRDFNLSDAFIADLDFLIDSHLLTEPLSAFAKQFGGRGALFEQAIADLSRAQALLRQYYPQQAITIDLASVGSYGYHSGLMFALYAPGYFDAVARGGRYDGVGQAYGRSRPATGFSADLLTIAQLVARPQDTDSTTTSIAPQNTADFTRIQLERRQGRTIQFEHKD